MNAIIGNFQHMLLMGHTATGKTLQTVNSINMLC